jgi:hypothetical protein
MRDQIYLPEELDDPKGRALLRPVPPPNPKGPKAPAPVMASGLETDEGPYLGLMGVVGLRTLADALEEHHVNRVREGDWSWAEVGAVLDVSPQAAHKKHAKRLRSATTELAGCTSRYAGPVKSLMRVRHVVPLSPTRYLESPPSRHLCP